MVTGLQLDQYVRIARELRALLERVRTEGGRVAAYGAPTDDSEAKSPAPDLIDYDATAQPGTSVAAYGS